MDVVTPAKTAADHLPVEQHSKRAANPSPLVLHEKTATGRLPVVRHTKRAANPLAVVLHEKNAANPSPAVVHNETAGSERLDANSSPGTPSDTTNATNSGDTFHDENDYSSEF